MKLLIRIKRQTSRVELPGEEPSLRELSNHIRQTVLSSHGFSADTEFSLSLNGSELLSDTDQTLSSCGIVSGDLIFVVLPESAADAAASSSSSNPSSSSSHTTAESSSSSTHQNQQLQTHLTGAVASSQQPSSNSSAALTESKESDLMLDYEPSVPKWEPMLCSEAEEGQAPLSLELLYSTAHTTSPSDSIVVAANLLMLETGFVPQGHELKPSEMPAGWRSAGGVYKLQYTHPLCENSLAMVVAVCMGAVLVVNATLKVNQTVDTIRKLCLSPASYVTNEWAGESAAAAFKDLRKLSRIFKDQLAYPLIASAREAMALPVAFGLAALPPELLLRVLRLLDVRSVVRLSSVCRRFNVATADSTLWRHLFRRDFSDSSRSRDTDWMKLYKRFYKVCSERQRGARHFFPADLQNPRDIYDCVRPPLFPPVPGIIGGDYDQTPNLPHNLLPRPRYDPIGLPPTHDGRPRIVKYRPADVRRGFI